MTEVRRLRWTEQAVDQLGAIAENVGRSPPVYAEQLVQRIATRLEQVRVFPASGAGEPPVSSHQTQYAGRRPERQQSRDTNERRALDRAAPSSRRSLRT